MISRRQLLAWLGIAPFAIAATRLPVVAKSAGYVPIDPKFRKRWKMTLNPDGSSDFVKGDKRFLDCWFDDRRKSWIQKAVPLNDLAELDMAEANHLADIRAMEDRSDVWRELREFEEAYERSCPIEYKLYEPGTHFDQDMGGDPEENRRRWRHRGLDVKRQDIAASYFATART